MPLDVTQARGNIECDLRVRRHRLLWPASKAARVQPFDADATVAAAASVSMPGMHQEA